MKHLLAFVFTGLVTCSAWAQAPAGSEFRVNTYTTWSQTGPSASMDAGGNFVVAWEGDQQDGDSTGVFGQRYDASGAPRGAEFAVNTFTTSQQGRPSVASDPAGNLVVVWESFGQDGYAHGVFARRFDASGAPLGGEFQVNTYTTNHQGEPDVAADANGDFVVVWNSLFQDGSGFGVFGQRFDASGARRGSEFGIATSSSIDEAFASVASDAAGNFVVVWGTMDASAPAGWGISGRRFDAAGIPRGEQFEVNVSTTLNHLSPSVSSDAGGNFVVVWESEDGNGWGVFARRYDGSGAPRGGVFQVNTYASPDLTLPSAASDASGNFVVTWGAAHDGDRRGIFGQRFGADGTRLGGEFQVNTYTTGEQLAPVVAADPVGNFVVAWNSPRPGSGYDVFGQRFAGLVPAALAVDATASGGSDGNSILEPDESPVDVKPSWRNVNAAPQTFAGTASSLTGPPAPGVSYSLLDAVAAYGTVPGGGTGQCADCYAVGIGFAGMRPALHWDAALVEHIAPGGQTKSWAMHVGESFTDVPRTSPFYRYVETLLHNGVTGGCGAESYCPATGVTREQMAPFVLVAKEGTGYLPPPCTTPVFTDVSPSSPFCRWIEELARRGIVIGCGGGNYCPGAAVARQQMPVFVLLTLDPSANPPACTTPMFGDVPATSPFCRWIEELARRGVVTGCGGGNYCPASAVTRDQMGVFISVTFGLTLYGP